MSGFIAGLTMVVGRGKVARLAAELAEIGPDTHVVDVGCGPGTAARMAARRGAKVTGVDPAPVMVGLARRTRPGAKGLASHGWTGERAEAFGAACRAAGFSRVNVDRHRGRLSTQMVVTAIK